MINTMKAWRLHSYGGPECLHLDDVPVPVPTASQVLVAVSVVGMNPFDWKIREGYVREMRPLPLPTTLGVDFSGTVVAIGGDEAKSRFKVGDRVMTLSTSLGAFAEYIAVDEKILAHVPAALSDTTAATLPIPVCSAGKTLQVAGDGVGAGTRVLIHGASGIVGAFAVQLAKARGATVIGTASGKNREYVLGLGADEFIDYQTENFEDRVKDIDVVLDYVLVGGDRNTTDRSWGVLKPNGAIVSVADPAITSKIPAGRRGYFPQIEANPAFMEEIAEQLVDGKIQSKVAQVFPRSELVQAMEANKAGGRAGRLLVDFKRA